MIRLTYVFTKPEDGEAFDSFLHGAFLPLVRDLPHVIRIEIGKPLQQLGGTRTIHMMLEIFFEDEDAMNRAHASAEGKRISRLLMSNQQDNLDLIVCKLEILWQ